MRKPKYDDKVIKLLNKGPLKAAQIAKTLSLRPGTMYKILDRLVSTGEAVKDGFLYSATGVKDLVAVDPAPAAPKAVVKPPIKSFLEKEIELVTDELNESLSKVYVLKAVKARLMMALDNARQSRP